MCLLCEWKNTIFFMTHLLEFADNFFCVYLQCKNFFFCLKPFYCDLQISLFASPARVKGQEHYPWLLTLAVIEVGRQGTSLAEMTYFKGWKLLKNNLCSMNFHWCFFFLAFFFFRETNRSKQEPFEKEKVLCDTLIGHFEKLHVCQAPDVSSATAADKELSLPQRAGLDEASVVRSSQ